MNGEEVDNELSHWFSTYGVITAERILGQYQIKLNQSDLIAAIKGQYSFYHRLLHVPLRNVLNGIILQQAHDFHVYAQKLFIDYLLSNESAKGEEEQGAVTRESLENERQQLIKLGEEFQNMQKTHETIIATTQASLISLTKEFNTELENVIKPLSIVLNKMGYQGKKSLIRQAVNHALIHWDVSNQSPNSKYRFVEKMNELLKVNLTEDVKEKIVKLLSKIIDIDFNLDKEINHFVDDVQEITQQANSFRSQFYETIIRVMDLMKALPDYKIDPEQDAINREPLYFDKSIGSL